MTPIALLIAANIASDAPERRADAHLYDLQLEVLGKGFAPVGLSIEPAPWSEPDRDWTRYGAVLAFCAWDYQDAHQDFLAKLNQISAQGVLVFNSPATIAWNIRKTYLRDFESWGVPVVPTLWREHPSAADLYEAFAVFNADDVVLKRQVGGGARAQMLFSRASAPKSGAIMDRPGMIQPLIRAIRTEGELSFLFIDGEFSHALVKRAKSGDYRIQEAYGGASARIDPAPADLRAARAALEPLKEMPLYARIDMVRGDCGQLLLMELEVIEPYLFPKDGPGIGARLGQALKRRI